MNLHYFDVIPVHCRQTKQHSHCIQDCKHYNRTTSNVCLSKFTLGEGIESRHEVTNHNFAFHKANEQNVSF